MTTSSNQRDNRAAWDVIEDACTSRFTGELVLQTALAGPAGTTNVYMTRGLIYLAEHPDEPPLGERLVAAGVITADLLPAGSPNTTDLDAMFSVDPLNLRERVETAIQIATETVLLDVARERVTSFRSTMYRHHPSGVDRWFSSQYARGVVGDEGCATGAPSTAAEEPVEPTPAPVHLIPPPTFGTDEAPEAVAEAVRRAVTAIDTATRTIGPAPRGFIRAPRRDDAAH